MLTRTRLLILAVIAMAIWLALVPVRIVGTQCVQEYRLEMQGVRTRAVVTALEPTNHQSVHYSYRADSTSFDASGRAGFGNPEFNQLRLGQEVTAVYLPAAPGISCLGSPRQLLTNDLIPFSLFLFIVIAAITYQCTRYRRGLTNRCS
jgi:hypothetical protein